jgi:hypothetical protein
VMLHVDPAPTGAPTRQPGAVPWRTMSETDRP